MLTTQRKAVQTSQFSGNETQQHFDKKGRDGQTDSESSLRKQEAHLLTSRNFSIFVLSDFKRSQGRLKRGWRVIGSISADGSYTSSSKKKIMSEEDGDRKEVSNEEQEVNSIFASSVGTRLPSSSPDRVNIKRPERVFKHPHVEWKRFYGQGIAQDKSSVSSSQRKNLYRVVTAVAPPFVQEATRIENTTCLTGVTCLRVSSIYIFNIYCESLIG